MSKKKKNNYTIYIILGILLLIGLFSLLYFKVIKGNSSSSKQSGQGEEDIIPTTEPTIPITTEPTITITTESTITTSTKPSTTPFPTPPPFPTPTPKPTTPIKKYTKPEVIDMIRDNMIKIYKDIMPAASFSTNFRILATCDIEYLLDDIPGDVEEEKLYYIVQTINDNTLQINNLPCYEKQVAAYFEIMKRNGYENTIETKVADFVKRNIGQGLFKCIPSIEGELIDINNAAEDCEYSAKERLAINTFKA
jgi:hypothetical protein